MNKMRGSFYHALIGKAKDLPTVTPTPVVSVSPIVIAAPNRLVDLQLRVSAPATGSNLPMILLSHGHGFSNSLSSLNGYGPLVNFWAAHGFIVIQPTHLSSKTLSFKPETPGAPLFWRERVEDMKYILDHLDEIEAAIPSFIKGRIDRTRIAIAGHSAGSHTASLLLGQQLTDDDGTIVDMMEPRIKAGVLLTPIGNGGKDLSSYAFENFKFFRNPKFATMTTQTLVVVGGDDNSPHLTTRGPSWHSDPYTLSSGPKSLVTLIGGRHLLGGISGYDAAEAQGQDDENPERLAIVERLSWAYLRSALYPEDRVWDGACTAMKSLDTVGWVESK